MRFIENRMGSHTTTHRGGQVTHTTSRERLLVWVLLIAFLGVAIGGFVLSQATADGEPRSEEPVADPDQDGAAPLP